MDDKTGNSRILGYALKGFSWNVAGNLVRSTTGFIINVVLARLLGPEPFGLVAIAFIVIGIGNLIIETGLGSALVQKEEISNQDIAYVFTLQMALGILLASIVVLISPYLAIFFSNPHVTPVLQVMALTLIIQAFAQVPIALLRRDLNFKRLQLAQIISFAVGYILFGLPMAFLKLGVWSLITAQLIQSIVNALIVYVSTQTQLSINFKGSHKLTLFGIRILGANIANWIIQNMDNTIIGWRFGTTPLGLYSRSYNLSFTPLSIVMFSAQTSLFSAISRMGKSVQTIRIFNGFMNGFGILFFPIFWIVAIEAQNIIQLIYGNEWLPAATLLTPLAIAMPLLAIVGLEGPVINGLGKPEYEMRAQWLTAGCAVLVLLLASNISIEVVAWSIVLIYLFRLIIMSVITLRLLEITWTHLIRLLFPGLLMGSLALIIWELITVLLPIHQGVFWGLLLKAFVTTLLWSIILMLGRNRLFPEFNPFIRYLFQNKNLKEAANEQI